MTQDAGTDLSGPWNGVYTYPLAGRPEVRFSAVLSEIAGLLSGEIFEPNTFCPDSSDTLLATLSGRSAGARVHFVKHYEAAPGPAHRVTYEGAVSAAGHRIEGTWRIAGEPEWWRGTFVMTRRPKAAAAARREVAAPVPQE